MSTEVDRTKGPSQTPPSGRLPEGLPGQLCFGLRTWELVEARGGRIPVLKTRGSLLCSPGAPLAADGARGAVALLHNHADVGFHELGHIHHLPGKQHQHTVRVCQGRGLSLTTTCAPSKSHQPAKQINPQLQFCVKPKVYLLCIYSRSERRGNCGFSKYSVHHLVVLSCVT